jgi:hypothetical protein
MYQNGGAPMKFIATYVDKCASIDEEDSGVYPKSATCYMSEVINVSAATLPALLKLLSVRYGNLDNYWDAQDTAGFVSFNCHEDAEGRYLSFEQCKAVWSKGQKVYLCDYTFRVVKRTEEYVSIKDMENAVEVISMETVIS